MSKPAPTASKSQPKALSGGFKKYGACQCCGALPGTTFIGETKYRAEYVFGCEPCVVGAMAKAGVR